jgi:hypothetical protein
MVYQQTNMKFNTSNVSSTSFGDSSGNNDVSGNDPWFVNNSNSSCSNSNVCEGSNCCSSGMTYNTGLNQCVETFQTLHPQSTPSLSSLSSSNSLPLPVLGYINKSDDPLISKDLDYNKYKNSTNQNIKTTSTWDTILTSIDQLISNKKADYTMGMNSLSGYNS